MTSPPLLPVLPKLVTLPFSLISNRFFKFGFRFLSQISVLLFISNSLSTVKDLTISHLDHCNNLLPGLSLFSSFIFLITTAKVHLYSASLLKEFCQLPIAYLLARQFPTNTDHPAAAGLTPITRTPLSSLDLHGRPGLPTFAWRLFLHCHHLPSHLFFLKPLQMSPFL